MTSRGLSTLDTSQGEWAVRFARGVVEQVVTEGSKPSPPDDVDPVFRTERGVFVTLEKEDELRGCIGRPNPEQTAIQAIIEAGYGAATNDPRFPPVSESELHRITVEVSVLTPPQPLEGGADTYQESINVGRDGLIIENGGRSGLLLPQVPVDRDWSVEEFLDQTCRKAGLPRGSWREEETTVLQFSAQVFAETEPKGRVEPAGLDQPE